ncbi:MAG TPA: pyridoxal-phosphate dependent enzyme, partial [Candidatus Limnocylindrales bacterium]|nr:pyridoxal-phosphate dependent enzyme [Candidatus Limnocylindrales bacterium]
QYWNQENPKAHERTTGPEIWRQTEGRITHFVCSVGTGGTVSGAARYLKAQDPAVEVVGADPEGSVLSGDTARPYLTEGVGEDFLPGTFDPASVDRWERVSDAEAFAAARRLTREEGILAGESCGTALVAALRTARRLMAAGDASRALLVVLLPDGGRSYLSKLYNDEWLRINGLLGPATGPARVRSVLVARHADGLPPVVVARTSQRVAEAIEILQRYGISQLPVSEGEQETAEAIVGSISEKGLLDRAYRDPEVVERTVGEVMDRPLPTVDLDAALDDAFRILSDGAPAIVVVDGERPAGVVTKLDLLEFLAHRENGAPAR